MLEDLPKVLTIDQIPFVVGECLKIAESSLQHLPPSFPRLHIDKAVAIAAYSFDLGFADSENNLYYVLNEVLRERNPQKIKSLQPYLWYLMTGLSELPAVEATVFRGVPFLAMDLIKQHYSQGVDVHWSAFTSTTTNINKAKSFAQEKGIHHSRIRKSKIEKRVSTYFSRWNYLSYKDTDWQKHKTL